MWKCFICIVFVCMVNDVYASTAEDMAEATQLCCNQGTAYARNKSADDCSSSPPPDVPSKYGSLCIFAMDECCKDYFQKKSDCDSGINTATHNKQCQSTQGSMKNCCNECMKGSVMGANSGSCKYQASGNSAEELLARDAFMECCERALKPETDRAHEHSSHEESHSITLSRSSGEKDGHDVTSVCEDYAPNELCAHHCIPVPGSYKCECNPGFMLMSDGRNCKEVAKNRCKPRNHCQHKCNDNGVEVKCSCRRGYQLMADGKSCEDIDECRLDISVCLPGTECHNIQGSYKCMPVKKTKTVEMGQCPDGFAKNLNNNACDDINECQLQHPPCPSYLCENTVGGYKCGGVSGDPVNLANHPRPATDDRCPPGFGAGYDEECEDVNECAIHKDDCNPLSQFCINTRGSFYCQDKVSKHCPPGFKIDPASNKCEDIDECEDGQDICKPDQICINVPGEYDCKPKAEFTRRSRCPEGMRMKPGSTVCEDIDECVEGTHLCDQYQTCLNTNGSHECHCKLGFELDALTGACTDVNECATDQHKCIAESQRCDNTVGSYLCIRFTSCGTGYILHHSSGNCEDVDECALGTHNCARAGPEYQCVNTLGAFRCVKRKTITTTTTTTTLPPEEYEYYYDEDESDSESNSKSETKSEQKSKQTSTTSTTTTLRPETSSQTSITPDTRTTETTRIVEVTPPQRTPDIDIRNDFKTKLPDKTDSFDHTYYEVDTNSEQNQIIKETSDLNETKQNEVKENETTYILSTESTYQTSPQVVFVKPGKETATVDAEKTEDGSVIVDTQNVPVNKWTKINEKPKINCQIGFEVDDYGACHDIDECASNRHSCSGLTETCRNTMGGYLCDCAPGFRRDLITGVCDLVTTSTSTSTTSPPPTIPTTTKIRNFFWGYPDYRPITTKPFRPRNLCDVGFHLNSKTGKCEDINECTNGQANCAAVEICVNTEGGYRCECPPHWKLDEVRHRCVPLRRQGQFPPGYGNQPVYPPVRPEDIPSYEIKGHKFVEPELTNLGDRGAVMKCPWGYRLGDDNTCEDIDECATGEAKCGPVQLCNNLPGGYTCSCPRGHHLVADHECADDDECALAGSTPICSQNADCINTIGSYQCRCHIGFRSAPANDKVCVDVDECTESRQGSLCQHRCNNVWGGYRCSCHRGYRLNNDNSTCSDIDECTEFKSKILCVGRCLNEPGSYKCTCPPGYRLSEDKRSCIDIDECETGEATCAQGGVYGGISDICLNTRGGYRCHRITCPPGYRLENKHRCTKVEKVCPQADWECAHQPSTYSYNFITFVSKLYIPASKVDLFTMKGPVWANTRMKFELRLVDVNAPPTVKDRADINAFLLVQTDNQAVVSLVRSLEGPQSIELELSMELYNRDKFGGTAVAKLFIHVSEYEF